MKVYLDNAATTAIAPEVVKAMVPIMEGQFGNPSSIHGFGRQARTVIEDARKKVAKLINASPAEIFFTSGGTEANNMALYCSVRDLGVSHIVTTTIEHHAVGHTAEELAKHNGVKVSYVKLTENGHVDLTDLEHILSSNTEKTLVSLMHANNEIGNLLPIKKVGEMCRKYNAYFHSDTVQTMGHYVHNVQDIPVDFINCSAHKFHGPKGIGFLYINSNIKIAPFIFGGAQERNMRGGTENIYGIVGLAAALELAYEHMDHDIEYVSGLKHYMIDQLIEKVPGVSFNGDIAGSNLYTVLNVSLPPSDFSEMLLFRLDIAGIAASGGSACSSGSNVGSHVLKGICANPDRPAVRFSFSRYTTKEEIDYCVLQLKEMYQLVNA